MKLLEQVQREQFIILKTRHKNLEKSEDQGPTPLQGEGAKTESKPALLYFQLWMKEYVGS